MIQFGFVTIFVASFPLAPLFAILNNVLEMRLDARKLLVFYRRPVGQRVRDIGIWYKILNTVGKLAVLSNVRTGGVWGWIELLGLGLSGVRWVRIGEGRTPKQDRRGWNKRAKSNGMIWNGK